jgi:hypothetical protein
MQIIFLFIVFMSIYILHDKWRPNIYLNITGDLMTKKNEINKKKKKEKKH